jgi:hypothetical protein
MTDPILQAPKFKDDDTPKHNPPIVPCWMTKREYFAALAMQGIITGFESISRKDEEDIPWAVDYSVRLAEALIERLEN